jgi:hypothetical protein
VEACLITAGSFRAKCQDALGLRAGAVIAVLGGLRAREEVAMATPQAQLILDLTEQVRELVDILERAALRLNPPALAVVRDDDEEGDDG